MDRPDRSHKNHPQPESANRQMEIPSGLDHERRKLHRLTKQAQFDSYVHMQRIAIMKDMLRRVHPDEYPVFCSALLQNLANAYCLLPSDYPDANVRKAIECYQQALEICPSQVSRREFRRALTSLGLAYTKLSTGDRTDGLRRAISCYERALTFCDPRTDSLDYGMILNALGAAYFQLPHGDWVGNLKKAILYYEKALTVYTSESHPSRYAVIQQNLGEAYAHLPTGDRTANLQQAIAYYQESLGYLQAEADPAGYTRLQVSLGDAYCRLLAGSRAINLRRGIEHYREALRYFTVELAPFEHARIVNDLGNAYYLFPAADRTAYLQDALACFEQALVVFSPETAPLSYAAAQNNLGMVFADWPDGEHELNLRESIGCYQKALSIYSPAATPLQCAATLRNLGNAYVDLSRLADEKLITQAMACFQRALSIYTLEMSPADHRRVRSDLGEVYFGRGCWLKAHIAYSSAIDADEMLYQAGATEISRQSELAEGTGLYHNDAYCLARLGCLSKAVERLESGRARALSEALARARAVLEDSTPEDREAFRAICDRIRTLETEARLLGLGQREGASASAFADLSRQLNTARKEILLIVEQIRSYLPDFMPTALRFDAIVLAVGSDSPLVYLITTLQGSLALIVPHGVENPTKDHVVWLDSFTEGTLDSILYDQGGELGFLHGMLQENERPFGETLDGVISVLGKWLMSPLADRLAHLGYDRCMLIPCGRLALLPLHAARLSDGRYLGQALELSYAPCARVLQDVQQQIPETKVPTLFAVVDPPHRQEVSLGEITLPLGIPRLPYSHLEARAVGAVFPEGSADVLWEGEATRSSTLAHIGGRSYLHFSCHGFFSPTEPLMSALMLAGEDRLTLADILNHLDLSAARLAVLSACRTAITEFQRVPDEAIGLPAGFIQAGVRGVIAALWSVHDVSTALLMGLFYRYHLQDGLSPVAALRRAQQRLRESTADELDLVSHFERRYQESGQTDKEAFSRMAYYRTHGDEKPFTPPYYWAAFAYYGAAQ